MVVGSKVAITRAIPKHNCSNRGDALLSGFMRLVPQN